MVVYVMDINCALKAVCILLNAHFIGTPCKKTALIEGIGWASFMPVDT